MRSRLLPALPLVLLLQTACIKTEQPWPDPQENYFTFKGRKVVTTGCAYTIYPNDELWDVYTTGKISAGDRDFHALGASFRAFRNLAGVYRIVRTSTDTLKPGTVSLFARDLGDSTASYISTDQETMLVVSVDPASGRVTLNATDVWMRNLRAPYDSIQCTVTALRGKQ